MNRIKVLQIIYCVIIAVAAFVAAFSETGIFPVDYIGDEPRTLYWVNLTAIFLAFGGMFLSLRMFVFKKVKSEITVEDENIALLAFSKWTKVRLGIIALSLWVNTILYFSTSYTSTPQYCILVTLVACVFCWPSKTAFDGLRKIQNSESEG